MIDKPKGGKRPVAMIAGFYKVWARARRNLALEWLALNRRDYLSNVPGNSPEQTVWREQVRAEVVVRKDGCAMAALLDMRKYFEKIPFGFLLHRAKRVKRPLVFMKVAFGFILRRVSCRREREFCPRCFSQCAVSRRARP